MGSSTSSLRPHFRPWSRLRWVWLRWGFALALAVAITMLMLLALSSLNIPVFHKLNVAHMRGTLAGTPHQATPPPAKSAEPRRSAAAKPERPPHSQPIPQASVSNKKYAVQPILATPQGATTSPPQQGPTPTPAGVPAAAAIAPPSAGELAGAGKPGAASGSASGGTGSHAAAASRTTEKGVSAQSQCSHTLKPRTPREAIEDGVGRGEVVARLFPDANGRIERVEILGSKPASHARYFEREVRRVLPEWRCSLGGSDDAIRQVFVFSLED